LSVIFLLKLNKKGLNIEATGEVAKAMDKIKIQISGNHLQS